MKKCSSCKKDKALSEYNKKGIGFQAFCRECNKEKLKKHYRDNPVYYSEKKNKRREQMLLFVRNLKLGCTQCSETHIACLDFHHIDTESKEGNITEMASNGLSKAKLLKEIQKCVVLCSNCHRKLHYKER